MNKTKSFSRLSQLSIPSGHAESLVHSWLAPDIPIVVEVGGSRPKSGDKIRISFDPHTLLAFDIKSGVRLS